MASSVELHSMAGSPPPQSIEKPSCFRELIRKLLNWLSQFHWSGRPLSLCPMKLAPRPSSKPVSLAFSLPATAPVTSSYSKLETIPAKIYHAWTVRQSQGAETAMRDAHCVAMSAQYTFSVIVNSGDSRRITEIIINEFQRNVRKGMDHSHAFAEAVRSIQSLETDSAVITLMDKKTNELYSFCLGDGQAIVYRPAEDGSYRPIPFSPKQMLQVGDMVITASRGSEETITPRVQDLPDEFELRSNETSLDTLIANRLVPECDPDHTITPNQNVTAIVYLVKQSKALRQIRYAYPRVDF
jgi:hypothetical protein